MGADLDITPVGIENVFLLGINGAEYLTTKNISPGISVYGERRIGRDPEYRFWYPDRSKLAAMILKKMKIPLDVHSRVLYLGAASGTTSSHVSDIASKGVVYAVEFSYKSAAPLLEVCKSRANLIPVFADARNPAEYAAIVERSDVIYQDIAQRDQVEIAVRNAEYFLKDNGHLIIALKSRSIDVTAKPIEVFSEAIEKLSFAFDVQQKKTLEPFYKDHMAVIARYRDS